MSAVLREVRAPFVLSNSARVTIAALLACTFALPIRIFGVGDFEIPFAILIVLAGLPTIGSVHRIPGGRLILLSAALSLVSVALWDLSPTSVHSFRPYFSYIFFFIPFVAYGAGYFLVKTRDEIRRIISLSASVGSFAGIGIAVTLLLTGLPVRIEGELQGSLLGLPLYATYGVNTLAITQFVLFAFVWIDLLYQRPSQPALFVLKFAGLVSLSSLVLLSLSRGATLSLAVFILISIVGMVFREPGKAAKVLAVLAIGGVFVGIRYGELVSLAWSTRLNQTVSSAGEGEVNDLTSGRLILVESAVGDILDNPLLGVGFTGFHDGKATFSSEDAKNSSPHDQYLTMLWKPGIPAGAILIAFVLRCVATIHRLSKRERSERTFAGLIVLMIALLGIAAFTWDVLLVPNIGAMVFFLFGACVSVDQRERLGGLA